MRLRIYQNYRNATYFNRVVLLLLLIKWKFEYERDPNPIVHSDLLERRVKYYPERNVQSIYR